MSKIHVEVKVHQKGGGMPYPAHAIPDGNTFEMSFQMDEQYMITLKKFLSLLSRENDMTYIRDGIHDQFQVE